MAIEWTELEPLTPRRVRIALRLLRRDSGYAAARRARLDRLVRVMDEDEFSWYLAWLRHIGSPDAPYRDFDLW